MNRWTNILAILCLALAAIAADVNLNPTGTSTADLGDFNGDMLGGSITNASDGSYTGVLATVDMVQAPTNSTTTAFMQLVTFPSNAAFGIATGAAPVHAKVATTNEIMRIANNTIAYRVRMDADENILLDPVYGSGDTKLILTNSGVKQMGFAVEDHFTVDPDGDLRWLADGNLISWELQGNNYHLDWQANVSDDTSGVANAVMRLSTDVGDKSDWVEYSLFAQGTCATHDNREQLAMAWNPVYQEFGMFVHSGGTGEVQTFVIQGEHLPIAGETNAEDWVRCWATNGVVAGVTIGDDDAGSAPGADNLRVVGNVAAASFTGDGSGLTGVSVTTNYSDTFVLAVRTNNQTIGTATATTIICNDEISDVGSNYDSGTGIYTCPSAGSYAVSGMITFRNTDAAISYFGRVRQDSANRSYATWNSTTTASYATLALPEIILSCTNGQALSISAYQASGGDESVSGSTSSYETYINVRRVW